MKISIIIPVFNEEKTVALILDKIFSVTLPENMTREVIVVTKEDSTVILTTTNSLANAISKERLSKLPAREITYEAMATGKFEELAYPTDTALKLKKGAQVIMIRNDPDKQWVNGDTRKSHRLVGRFASLF